MNDLSSKTCCVVDHSLFLPLAMRLAREDGFGRVLYYCPWEKAFPELNSCIIGDGFSSVERIDDFWSIKRDIDCFVFPDIEHGPLQQELASQGFPVWGSRGGDRLEMDRVWFKEMLPKLGLAVAPYKVCTGLAELTKYLKDKEDAWLKVSKYRGNWETKHWVDWATSRDLLDLFALKFGSARDNVPVVVEDAIPTKIEWGADGYFCGGKFPALLMHGPEIKDKCYAASIVSYGDLPDEIKSVNEAVKPLLVRFDYRNFFSTEVRVAEDDTPYFIDPTCRMGSPVGELMQELFGNLPEIIWAGANGYLLDPEPTALFGVEAMIEHQRDEAYERRLVVPKNVRQWTKVYGSYLDDDGVHCIPPFNHSCEIVGGVIGIGDTMEEAIEHLKANAAAFNGQPVTINTDSLVDALQEIHHAESKDLQFSEHEMPEPESVINGEPD